MHVYSDIWPEYTLETWLLTGNTVCFAATVTAMHSHFICYHYAYCYHRGHMLQNLLGLKELKWVSENIQES